MKNELKKLALMMDIKNDIKNLERKFELLLNDIKLANYREHNATKKRFRTF